MAGRCLVYSAGPIGESHHGVAYARLELEACGIDPEAAAIWRWHSDDIRGIALSLTPETASHTNIRWHITGAMEAWMPNQSVAVGAPCAPGGKRKRTGSLE